MKSLCELMALFAILLYKNSFILLKLAWVGPRDSQGSDSRNKKVLRGRV